MQKFFLILFSFFLLGLCSNLLAQTAITGNYCTATTISTVSGTSAEVDGTNIEVFINGNSEGTTPVLSGSWSMTGLNLVPSTEIYAKDDLLGIPSNTVTVGADPILSLSVGVSTNPICEGNSTDITVAASEVGFSYQLRNDADDSNVGAPVAGTGGTINLPTGNITSTTTYNIYVTWTAPPNCSGELLTVETVSVNALPTTANAGVDQTLCNTTSTTLSGNNPTTGTGAWTVTAGGGTVDSPSDYNSTVSNLAVGINTFRWTISNSPCTASTDDITINVSALPTTANAGVDQTLCNSNTTTLTANNPTSGTGMWTVTAGSATVDFPSIYNSTVSNLSVGANTFLWTVSNAPCPASTNDVIINVRALPTANAGVDQTLCNATTATLSATNPAVGTGAWTVTAGSGIVTSPSAYNSAVTNLSVGANTFLWTVSNAPCTAATNDVTINVSALPTANAGIDQTLCSSTTTTLSATNPAAGTGVWTVTAGSGVVTSPAVYNSAVTNLSVGANTFLWTVSNAPCTAATNDVTIDVSALPTANAGVDQTLCSSTTATLSATNPTAGTGAWTVTAGSGVVTSPSVYNSPVTNLSVGANTFLWTVSNAPCTAAANDVTINIRALPTPTANAGPDQTGVSMCGVTTTTIIANAATVGTGSWGIVSGSGGNIVSPNSPTSVFSGTAGTTYLLRWTIANSPCTATDDDVFISFWQKPTIANAGPAQTGASMCGVTTTTLTANAATVGTGSWGIVSGSGGNIVSPNSPTSVFSGTAGTTYILRWTISTANCTSTDDVTITFGQNPTVANAGNDQTICSNNATLAGNTPGIGSGLWTFVSGSGNITTPTSSISGITGLTAGTSAFKWTVTNGACSSFDFVQIINGAGTPTVNAGPDQSYCSASTTTATITGNTSSSGVGAWSVIAGGASVDSPSFSSSGVSNLTVGTNTFRWTITDALCTASDDITINISAPPATANVGPDQTICSSTTTLQGNNPLTGTGMWSVVSGGTATITSPSAHNSTVSNLSVGSHTFRWTISNAPCSSSTDDVTITVKALPTTANAGSNQTICSATTATSILAGNSPGGGETGVWTKISGTATIVTPSSPTSGVTGLTVGASSIFQWTILNGFCTSSSTVTITVKDIPTTSNAGTDQTICNATTVTLGANAAGSGETGVWSLVSGTGAVTTPNSPTSGVTGLTIGASSIFQWTISNGFCTSSSTVTITVKTPPTNAIAGTDQTLCNVTTGMLAGNNPTTGTGFWTVTAGGGTVNSPTVYNSNVSNLSVGVNTFSWTISNAPCAASSDNVNIIVKALPTIAVAGTDQMLCNVTTGTLAGNNPTTGTGFWTVTAGGGTVNSPTVYNSTVSNLSVGMNTLSWTISNAPCAASSDNVNITISAPVTIPNAGPDQTLCNVTTATLAGNTAATGSGVWSKVSGSGTVTTPGNPTSGITGLTVGTSSVFRWTITNGACTAFDDVTINISAPATVANAGVDQTICSSNATLAGNTPSVGTGMWTSVSGSGAVTTPTSSTSGITGLTAGTSVFKWTITNGACSSFDNISIINGNVPVINAGPDQTLCGATTVTLAGNTPASGTTGQWSVVAGGASVTSPTSPTSGVTNLSVGINTFRWTITDGGCVATDDITVKVNSAPTTANAGLDQTGASLCGVTTTTLTANAPTVGTGQWSIISGSGGSFGNVLSPASAFSGTAGTTYVLRWTVSNPPCTSSTDDVTITFGKIPTTANAGTDKNGPNMCGVTTTTLTANAPTVGTGQWSIVSGAGGNFGNVSSPASAFSGTAGTTYVLRWTISNSPCTASTDDVTVSFWKTPTTANAGTDQTVCSGNATLAGNNPSGGTGTWTKISGSGTVTITSPGSPTTTVTGLVAGTSIFRWTIKNDSCTSFDDVAITNGSIAAVNAGVDQSLCSVTIATLAGNTPASGTTGQWSVIAGGASVTSPTNPASGVTNLSLGVNTFRWTITNGTCTASDDVTINVSAAPTTANAGPDQTGASMCGLTSTTLAGNIAAIGTGQWSVVSGTGGSFLNANSPTTSFTGTAGTSYVLRWTISNAICTPSTDDVTVIFWQSPTLANAGPDQNSLSTVATLAGNTPVIGTGAWTVISGAGSVTTPSNPNSGVTGLSPGKNTFRWTISSPPCPDSFDDVNIFANLNNLPPIASNDTVVLAEDGFISIDVQANDKDPNLDLLITSIVKGSVNGTAILNGNKIDYFPNKDFNGQDTIMYAVCDTATPSLCDTALVFITVTPVNDPLTVKDTSISTKESKSVTACLQIKDVDMGQIYTLSSCGNPVHGTYTASSITGNQFCITYTPVSNYYGLDSICIIVCDNGIPSLCDTAFIHIKVLKGPVITLDVSGGFSPNGDGVNDLFQIPGIEKYPNNHIIIFNQWGNLMYEAQPYENKWDGTNQGNGSAGGILPTGTYYFVLDLGDGSTPIKKYIYLSR